MDTEKTIVTGTLQDEVPETTTEETETKVEETPEEKK